jgi:hypothetical protein
MNLNHIVSHDSATPQSVEKQKHSKAIQSVLQTYLEGGRSGDASIMKHAFRANATIHGYIGGSLLAGPIKILFDWVTENPASPDLHGEIASIDHAGTIATARVEVTGWLGFRFTDQFTLLNENDAWIITSKVFHTHELINSN